MFFDSTFSFLSFIHILVCFFTSCVIKSLDFSIFLSLHFYFSLVSFFLSLFIYFIYLYIYLSLLFFFCIFFSSFFISFPLYFLFRIFLFDLFFPFLFVLFFLSFFLEQVSSIVPVCFTFPSLLTTTLIRMPTRMCFSSDFPCNNKNSGDIWIQQTNDPWFTEMSWRWNIYNTATVDIQPASQATTTNEKKGNKESME